MRIGSAGRWVAFLVADAALFGLIVGIVSADVPPPQLRSRVSVQSYATEGVLPLGWMKFRADAHRFSDLPWSRCVARVDD